MPEACGFSYSVTLVQKHEDMSSDIHHARKSQVQGLGSEPSTLAGLAENPSSIQAHGWQPTAGCNSSFRVSDTLCWPETHTVHRHTNSYEPNTHKKKIKHFSNVRHSGECLK